MVAVADSPWKKRKTIKWLFSLLKIKVALVRLKVVVQLDKYFNCYWGKQLLAIVRRRVIALASSVISLG